MRNAAIRRLDEDELRSSLLRGADTGDSVPVELCTASLADWNRFVRSENQVMKSKFMEWRDGMIRIVELGGYLHEDAACKFNGAMMLATGTCMNHLKHHGADHADEQPPGLENEPLTEPDCSFGPHGDVPGAVLAQEFTRWNQFSTVKVDIGVCEGWESLNRKLAVWRRYPGVEYVVSIRFPPELRICQYRLEQHVNGQFPGNADADRARILPIGQNTILRFDARRLLGFPVGHSLPRGFNESVEINLFEMVDLLRRNNADVRVPGRGARPADP